MKPETSFEQAVRRELLGPSDDAPPQGRPVDCAGGALHFDSREASYGQFHDAATGQEILTQLDPLRRYGIGVLYGGAEVRGTRLAAGEPAEPGSETDGVTGLDESGDDIPADPPEIPEPSGYGEADTDDFDLTDANTFKPSAMAVSFQCLIPPGGSLAIAVSGAYYDRLAVHIPGVKRSRDWWLRRPFTLAGNIPGDALLRSTGQLKVVRMSPGDPEPRIVPAVRVYSRLVPGSQVPGLRLVTVAVVNEAHGSGPVYALFQMGFQVTAAAGAEIVPYPEAGQSDHDEEEQSIDLLYRNRRTFAIGHGCAADWGKPHDGTEGIAVDWVRSDPLPAYEVTGLTPDVYVRDEAGERVPVAVSMAALADGLPEGHRQVESVLRLYADWIGQREQEVPGLPAALQPAARRHLDLCRETLERMSAGWGLANSDPIAARAFRLANEAMLYQQLRSRLPLRPMERGKDDVWRPVGPQPEPVPQPGRGNWRPFQIAFLLAALPELVDRRHPVPVARRPDLLPDRRRQDRGVPRRGRDLAARPAAPRPAGRRHRRDHALHAAAADGPAVPARRRARLRPGGHPLSAPRKSWAAPRSASGSGWEPPAPRTGGVTHRRASRSSSAVRTNRMRSCCCAARGAGPRWGRSPAKAEARRPSATC